MSKKFLEFGHRTKQRLGSYAGAPGAIEITIGIWHSKEGEIIDGKQNPVTGTVTGGILIELESSEKGIIEIDAIDEEIGAKIIKILMPVGYKTSVDFSTETLRLAILEIDDADQDDPDVAKYLNSEIEQNVEVDRPEASAKTGQYDLPVSPLAKRRAKALNVDLNELIKSLPESVKRVGKEHVEQFANERGASDNVRAAPSTRKFARDNDVDLDKVNAAGPDGIIKESDVVDFLESQKVPTEEITETPGFKDWEIDLYAPEIVIPTKMRQAVARNLRKAQNDMVLVGGGRDVNFTPLMALRKKIREKFESDNGIKLRLDHFFIAAVLKALKNKEFDDVVKKLNARWEIIDDENARMVLYGHINFAIAIAGPTGLVTPVIKKCEEKTFVGLAKSAEELITRALAGKLTLTDFLGMTFTVNNTGVFGDEYPDPIPNPGTSGIIAFAAARHTCICSEEEWRTCQHRKPAMLKLNFDHQILDGHEIGPFMANIKNYIEEPEQLLYLAND